jgi:hypothetical protein
MNRKILTDVALLVLSFVFLPQAGNAQEQTTARRFIPAVSVFVSGDYFAPNFGDVNAAYSALESNYMLPGGNGFKNYYSVTGGISFSPVEQQSIQAELGTSLFRSGLENSARQGQSVNFLQMYYAGGTYLVNLPVRPMSFFIGAGLGYVWLKTQRTYSVVPGVARIDAGLLQLHGTVGVEYIHSTGVSVGLEVGYSYAATPSPARADLDFTLKGLTGGLKLSVPIVNSL